MLTPSYYMDTQQQQIAGLSLILRANRNQLSTLKAIAADQQKFPVDVAHAAEFLEVPLLDQLESLTTAPTPERMHKIRQFLITLTPAGMEWIEAVRQTTWDAFNWSSKASQLFMQAESLGISGTVSYAVLAASMTIQGFDVPNDLNKRLYGAKVNAQRQRDDLAAAERRRAEELKVREDGNEHT